MLCKMPLSPLMQYVAFKVADEEVFGGFSTHLKEIVELLLWSINP